MTTTHRRVLASRASALALLFLVLGMLLAACGGPGASPISDDPYTILARAADADYDRIKLGLGLKTSGATDGDITIEPDAIELIVDSTAGTGSLRLSLPVAALGASGADLAQLGVTGDRLDVEVVFDGDALYARSPLFGSLLPLLMAQTGQTIDGDLTGWLQLGTVGDLESLTQAVGALPSATPAPSGALTDLEPAELKAQLEEGGVVMAFAGTEQRNGAEAQHVTATVDLAKLASSDMASQLPADQLSQVQGLAGQGSIKVDLWFTKASGALSELVVEASEKSGQAMQMTVLVSDAGAVTIEAPAAYVKVPLLEMLMPFLQMFGGSLMP